MNFSKQHISSPMLLPSSRLSGGRETWLFSLTKPRALLEQPTKYAKSLIIPTNLDEPETGIGLSNLNQIWARPIECDLKLNFDGSWIYPQNEGGIGWLIRDTNGNCCAAGAKYFACTTSEEAEATALLEGISWAKNNGMKNLEVEGDAMFLIDRINKRVVEGTSTVCNILVDIVATLDLFDFVSCKFKERCCNRAAHVLAHWARVSGDAEVWLSPPPFVKDVVEDDNAASVSVV